MTIPHNRSIANPGAFYTDTKKGYGYGKTDNGGLGDEWTGKDAIFNPVGPFDDRESRLLGDDNIEEEDIDKNDIEIHNKIHTSYNVQKNDPYSIKKTDPYSFHKGYITSSYNRSQGLIESYIKEVLLNELGMSGNIAVASAPKGKNTGNKSRHYHIDNTTLGSMQGVHNGVSIDQVGSKQNLAYKNSERYMSKRNLDLNGIKDDWSEDNITTLGNLIDATSEESEDERAVLKHNNKKLNYRI